MTNPLKEKSEAVTGAASPSVIQNREDKSVANKIAIVTRHVETNRLKIGEFERFPTSLGAEGLVQFHVDAFGKKTNAAVG